MSYLKSYHLLEDEFSHGECVQRAVMGDVFLFESEVGDLSVPIGSKIERAKDEEIATRHGKMILNVLSRVIQLDPIALEVANIDHDIFSLWLDVIKPPMIIKQQVRWEESIGGLDKPVQHETRAFTNLVPQNLNTDADEAEYQEKWLEWLRVKKLPADTPMNYQEIDYDESRPRVPRRLAYHTLTEISSVEDLELQQGVDSPPPKDPWVIVRKHFDVLRLFANSTPGFEHFATETLSYGNPGHRIFQTPEQFRATVQWLLDKS